jgi:hypothetical protein
MMQDGSGQMNGHSDPRVSAILLPSVQEEKEGVSGRLN